MTISKSIKSANDFLERALKPDESTIGVSVSGTYSGQLQVRGKIAGHGQWVTLLTYNVDGTIAVLDANASSDLLVDVAGYQVVRIDSVSFADGEAIVSITPSNGSRGGGDDG